MKLATAALSTLSIVGAVQGFEAPFGNGTDNTANSAQPAVNVAGDYRTTSTIQLTSVLTNIVSEYTTFCPFPTTFVEGGHTYEVSEATTITVTDCPCTRKTTYTTSITTLCANQAEQTGSVIASSAILQANTTKSNSSGIDQSSGGQSIKTGNKALWAGMALSSLVTFGVMAGLV
ncbi:hypothetical protein NADFUDRAFT_40923 [Nadsonia fulvescens var. elongata DSM 6958]|uniref:Uncharacterized protein n=1 Tax=Nadsonia fulvescens var. elongata DSM 6958 TaxID=857566 RepID=A0A1E3PLF8_9ASCO|nr:hypothetical protein NADFUDRAFT_40923 [Nadsonia fulvescens var. elongata DSM 6958]